jgi:replication-associated recombination protein RarA
MWGPSAWRFFTAASARYAPYVGSAQFTGRDAEVARLVDWVQSQEPVMVIQGIGGTGKSALAWELAKKTSKVTGEPLARFWWSFYEQGPSVEPFLRELSIYASEATSSPVRRDEVHRLSQSEMLASVLAALESKPFLLVLDGCETALDAYHRPGRPSRKSAGLRTGTQGLR